MKKQKTKKVVKKASPKPRVNSTEIVLRVAPAERVPTTDEIAEPISENKQLAISKTWISDKQIMRMVQRTPKEHVYERPAKGGGTWAYVTGNYVEKVLNFVFGFLWDFEIISEEEKHGQIVVHGKLTVKSADGKTISKSQYGRADIKYRKNTNDALDYGNDKKAAATDCLKKCASLFGIASDIYGKTEYKQETGYDTREVNQTPSPKEPSIQVGEIEDTDCHGYGKKGCPEGKTLKKQERDFSMRFAKKPLCRNCFAQFQQAQKSK